MKQTLLTVPGVACAALFIAGYPQQSLWLALAFAMAEICSLFALEMYYISSAADPDGGKRRGRWNLVQALICIGFLSTILLPAERVQTIAGVYMLIRMAYEHFRIRTDDKKKATPFMRFDLFRAFPEAFLLRGVYLVPAAALCASAWFAAGINLALPYAAGLIVFSLLRVENRLTGAEAERFPVRWLLGGFILAACVLTGFGGIFTSAFCTWAVLAALLSVQRNGRAWLCALLCVLQAACGYMGVHFGMTLVGGLIAAALWALMILLQRGAVYAAWLPVRAWFIRRRVK